MKEGRKEGRQDDEGRKEGRKMKEERMEGWKQVDVGTHLRIQVHLSDFRNHSIGYVVVAGGRL